jgi:hypothetical protein
MRSQVQVLAGPPPIPAGHSAAGSEPGAPAASLGRAGAARPSPPARPSALPDPSTRPAASTTHHPPWSPTQPRRQPHRPLRPPRAGACSRAHRAAVSEGAPHAGLACLVAQPVERGRPPSPHLARVRHRPPVTNARPRQRRPRPGLLGRPSSRSKTRQPTGTRPVPVVAVAGRLDLVPTPPPEVGRGWTRPDGRGGQQPGGHRTGWTPDGLDTGRLDRRTRTTEPLSGHHMV